MRESGIELEPVSTRVPTSACGRLELAPQVRTRALPSPPRGTRERSRGRLTSPAVVFVVGVALGFALGWLAHRAPEATLGASSAPPTEEIPN